MPTRHLSPKPDGDAPGADWPRYLAAFGRYKWIILALVVIGTLGGVVTARMVPPTYVAQATVWVPGQSRGQEARGPIQQPQLFDTYGWIELLKTSFVVLDDVVRDLRLYLSHDAPADSAVFSTFYLKERFLPGSYRLEVLPSGGGLELKTGEGLFVSRGPLGDSVGANVGFGWVPPPASLRPGQRVAFSVRPPRDAALHLQHQLEARITERGANFLSIRLEGPDAQLITAIVNRVARGFVDTVAALTNAKQRELLVALADQLDSAESRLHKAEVALEAFRVQTITEPSERGSPVPGGIQETRDPVIANFLRLRMELDGLRHDREAIERVLATVPQAGLSPDALLFVGSVQSSADLSRALADLTVRQAELSALRLRYTDLNPEVQRAGGQIQELQRRVIPDLARELLSQMTNREREVESRIASASQELRQIPRRSTEEQRLGREMTIAASAYGTLKSRYQDAKFAESAGGLGARVLDAAVVPQRPVRDNAYRLILMAFAGSLGLGLFGAIMLDRIDRRVRYPDQVSRELGLPILGAIPRIRTRTNGGAGIGKESLQVIEALRGVRLGLVHSHGAAGPLVVTVTSPGAAEGKSFVVSNLALAFADAGHRTVLIDGDVRRGELHRLLNTNRKPGLIDFLTGQAERDRVVQTTQYARLSFIGGGTRTHGAPELLTSPAMQQLLLSLRGSFDVILLDSPPLGAGVDPYVLGTVTGNLLLVLRTGVTDRELAEAKLDMLDRLPIRVLGAVLNDVEPKGRYRYYGYQYYVGGYETQDESGAAIEPRLTPE